jgi:phosphohistidine phosphatase
MNLYLIRHADAVEGIGKPERPLSPRGRDQVLALATFLQRSDLFQPAEFWHSPLDRSRETAELLAGHLRLGVPQTSVPELQPESDPRTITQRIRTASHAIAIVGHEPHLGALATLLVTGKMDSAAFVMKKCSALALEGESGHWSVRWHVSPDLIK